MNKFYDLIPRPVKRSAKLSSTEKLLWVEVSANLDNAGCCRLSNKELANQLHVSETMVSLMIANLKKHGYMTTTYETRNHARRLYPKYPGEIDEKLPSGEQQNEQIDKLQEACQKAVKLDELHFLALVRKLKGSPILDEIEDNSTQFALSLEQIKFLGKFMELFPGKEIDIQLASVVAPIDYNLLLSSIRASDFLSKSDNISLRWLITNYDEVVSGKYQNFVKFQEQKGREYTREELNALIQSVDEIQI